jgi:hypothetical protein
MNAPSPITDLVSFLKSRGEPLTEENIRQMASMLSMTEGEVQLALMLVERKAA